MAYAIIIHTKQLLYFKGVSFWVGAVHELQLANHDHETVLKHTSHSCLDTSGAFVHIFWAWHVYIGHTHTAKGVLYRLQQIY